MQWWGGGQLMELAGQLMELAGHRTRASDALLQQLLKH
jgi:hypothetical protein